MIETTINNLEINQRKNEMDKLMNSDEIKVDKMTTEKSETTSIRSPKTSPKSLVKNELDVNVSKQEDNQQFNSTLLLPDNQIKYAQMFGPFTDPIQWLAIHHSSSKHSLPNEFCSIEPDLLNLFRSIQMANSDEDQNMEIIVKNNKFYFRAMQTIDLTKKDNQKTKSGLDKSNKLDNDRNDMKLKNNDTIELLNEKPLFAWFSNELSSRLPIPAVSLINGNKRYFCTKCNQVFMHPNPAILHILSTCASSTNVQLSSISSNERLASPSVRLDNNSSSSLSISNSSIDNDSLIATSPISTNNFINSISNKTTIPSSTITSTSFNSSPINTITDTSYTPLNGSLSLANSKILKNLEAKLCKQFNSSISNGTVNLTSSNNGSISSNPNSSNSNNNSNNLNNNSNNSIKLSSGQTKSSKPKKRAFDIDSLVNNIDVPTQSNKKHKSNDNSEKKSAKNEKVFKTPLSTSKTNNDNLTNSTLINTLNSPLVNSLTINSNNTNGLSSSFLNPFAFLDPTGLAAATSNLPSAFHKVENTNQNKSILNSNNLTDPNSLLNAAMFSNPNFTNPFDFATIYAQHQRNLLQSMFNQNQTNQLSNNSPVNNYIQNQLTNPLFASQNLANLSTLNSLNNFNGLSNLLVNNQTNNSLTSGLPNSLANSLFAGLSVGQPTSSSFNQTTNNLNSQQSTSQQQQSNFNSTLLDPFVVPQTSTTEKSSSKKKKNKDKDLNNNSCPSSNNSKLSNQTNNLTNSNRNSSSLNDNSSKLNSLIPPSYFQFLSPSLAALSSPQSNWCAKCNISFRMTSDLVYHMRSQHKEGSNEQSSSPTKSKREVNKLFCHICGESFKERHHLTRHMISH